MIKRLLKVIGAILFLPSLFGAAITWPFVYIITGGNSFDFWITMGEAIFGKHGRPDRLYTPPPPPKRDIG